MDDNPTPPQQQGYTFDPQPPPRPSVDPSVAPPISAMQAMRRPLPVAVSFWTWFLASLVALATAVAALTAFDRMKAEIIELARQQDASVEQATLDQVALAAIAVLVGAGALIALLQLGAAALMHTGRHWARIVLLPVGAVGVIYGLVLFGGVSPPALGSVYDLVRVGLIVYVILAIVAAVVMFLSGARPWFERPQPSDAEDFI